MPNTDTTTNKTHGFARLPQVSASGRAGEAGGASPVPGGAAPPIPPGLDYRAGQPASEVRGNVSLAGVRGSDLPPASCVICGTTVKRHRNGEALRSCTKPTCRTAVYSGKHLHPEYAPQWPRVTGDIDFNGGFGRHNVTEPRVIGRNPIAAPSRSLTGCSVVLAYRGGGA